MINSGSSIGYEDVLIRSCNLYMDVRPMLKRTEQKPFISRVTTKTAQDMYGLSENKYFHETGLLRPVRV